MVLRIQFSYGRMVYSQSIEQCAKNQEQLRGLLEYLSEQGTVELTVEKIESPTKSKSVH